MNSVVPNTSVILNTDTGCLTQHGGVVTDQVLRSIHFNETCISPRDSIELLLAADLTPYLAP